jgi:hypothetical protein
VLKLPEASQPPRGVKRYAGRVICIYAFDVTYEMLRLSLPQLLGQPVAQFAVDASRRNPRHLFFYRPHLRKRSRKEAWMASGGHWRDCSRWALRWAQGQAGEALDLCLTHNMSKIAKGEPVTSEKENAPSMRKCPTQG